jgi:hypothetical protein
VSEMDAMEAEYAEAGGHRGGRETLYNEEQVKELFEVIKNNDHNNDKNILVLFC